MTHGRDAILAAAISALEQNRFDEVPRICAPLSAADATVSLLLGLAAGGLGQTDAAAGLLHTAARGRGTAAHPIRDLIALLVRICQPARIAPQIEACLRAAPDDPGLLHDIADYYYEAGHPASALPLLTEALHLAPNRLATRNLRAMALAAVGRTHEARSDLRHILREHPHQPGAWANLGLLLKDDGDHAEAIAAYDTAVGLAPEDAQVRVNRVVALLCAGRWAEAWPDYEWRLTLAGQAARRPNLLPMLSTSPDLSGKTILAVHEDGFGDTLHFARYLPMLAARGARVVASVPATLTRLIGDIADVVDRASPWPAHDFYCPFFSLPRAFETTRENIPALVPYLRAEPSLAERWRQRLPGARFRVGLIWAGQARPNLPGFSVLDSRRSMTLGDMAPLAAVPDITFVSLQHGPESKQTLTPPDRMRLFDPMDGVKNFSDTAAIIANLDLVISVDTAVAHLAGAMGKPVFLLDRYDHCWRWFAGRTDTPWYPTMHIFRQTNIGDWPPVLAEATKALAALSGGTARHAVGVDLLKIPKTVQGDA